MFNIFSKTKLASKLRKTADKINLDENSQEKIQREYLDFEFKRLIKFCEYRADEGDYEKTYYLPLKKYDKNLIKEYCSKFADENGFEVKIGQDSADYVITVSW